MKPSSRKVLRPTTVPTSAPPLSALIWVALTVQTVNGIWLQRIGRSLEVSPSLLKSPCLLPLVTAVYGSAVRAMKLVLKMKRQGR